MIIWSILSAHTSTALGSQFQPTRMASVGAEGICTKVSEQVVEGHVVFYAVVLPDF